MQVNYLKEAFKAMNRINEDAFPLDANGAEKLKRFIDGDDVEEIETVIDPDVKDEDDLAESYVGRIILRCPVCTSMIYKRKGDVVLSEDEYMANVGESCPYCQTSDGFKIIGEVAAVGEDDFDDNSSDVSVEDNDMIEERGRDLKEDINAIDVHTDEDCIRVTRDGDELSVKTWSDENVRNGRETIRPLSKENEMEITQRSEEVVEDEYDDGDYEDVDLDEFDSEEFDELEERYLKEVYDNVRSYKTIRGKLNGNKIVMEGVITFNSGRKVNTATTFRSDKKLRSGKLQFLGENKHLAGRGYAYTLTGKAVGKRLMLESLTYRYSGKDASTGKKQPVQGRVKLKRK